MTPRELQEMEQIAKEVGPNAIYSRRRLAELAIKAAALLSTDQDLRRELKSARRHGLLMAGCIFVMASLELLVWAGVLS